ncbi:TonB-dependent receptor [Parabacteroides sp. OttesenSCG-928-G07]|nr:TonB-dependent receptor [Parabacteroides sp. OttesenSCG-928-G21]MDL2278430.1 TonB-dependent receptor [Parabacteroides sp. OttesenSCG-928-G07]
MSKSIFCKKMFLGTLLLLFSTNIWAVDNVRNTSDAIVDDVLQGRTITVTVVDNMGPVIGANVIIKGTTNGDVTNLDGNVRIQNVPNNAILVVSYIGYVTREIPVENQTNISVTLAEDTQTLDEVIVVGYGVQKKSQVTGAISQVKSEDMENRAFSDATQALQGKTAGVQIFLSSGQPGTAGSVRVRGMGSNSNNDPLYVVDGRQVNDINYLDSDDIESMEILKDASAAAIYGARAGNGVILITTKKGDRSTKGSIQYRFMNSWQSNNNVPTMLNAQQFYDYQTTLSASNQSALDADWGDRTTDTDWLGHIFGTGILTRHNLAFSGGNSDMAYYIALSSNTNDGPVIGTKDKYVRYTATFNGEYQVKPWLKVTTNNNISYAKTNGGANVFGSAMRMSPLFTPTVSEPTSHMASYIDQGYNLIQDKDGNYATLPVYSTGDDVNPINTLNRSNAWSKGSSINGTTALIFTPIKDFIFTSRLGYNINSQRSYSQELPGVYSSQSSSYNQTVEATERTGEGYQWENFANYTKSFGLHNMTLMAGMSYIQNRSSYVTGRVQGTGTNSGFQNLDPLYAYFAYKSGSYSQTASGGEEYTGRKIAYYGRINYDYDNKYFFQASLRADAADLSQLPANGRWGYFPAGSVGWTVSNEDFMKDINSISHLKLRASWGQNGSTAGLSNYTWQSAIASSQVYSFNPDQMIYVTGKLPSTAGNENLKWETSEQLDLGFDVRLLNNRLSFSYDWYKKTTKDLILTGITPSYVMGITASPFNAGKVENMGHEFEVTWRDQIGKDFSYSISGNFTTLKNEVKEITSTLTYIAGASQDSQTVTWFEQGYPMWHFKTYHYTGVDENGNPTFYDVNDNGILDADDKVDCGSGIPTYSYGLTITANYKNFDLIVFGAGQGGNKIFQTVTRAFQLQSNVPAYLLEDAWTETNRNTNVPKVGMDDVGYYYVSDAQIFKGDYFKLKQLQVGYTIPSNLTKKLLIENLRIYASCENLFTITDYPGFDPEIMSSGNSMGIDSGRYPNNRNYILGVNLTF